MVEPKRKPPELSSKSKAGPQTCHPARVRGLVPRDQVDATRHEYPTRCGICGAKVSARRCG